ncbi:MAG: META domain-containing protein [Saprospiraceae bacterium]|nr:META domain-containing protein [Saprospiraceae bacterium]
MKNTIFVCFAMGVLALMASCKSEPVGGALANSYWTLTAAKLGRKTVQFPKAAEVSLQFSEEKISGKAPCNSFFGEYEAKGSAIKVGEIGSTKRACDKMEQEDIFLSLLSKANSYSIEGDKLEVFGSDGQLTFFRMKKEKADALRYAQGVGRLEKQFPALEAGDALHLFPILRVDNPGNYPYQGSLVDTSFYQYFSTEIREIWQGGGGDVLAVGHFGDFFVCRVPGRYVSSDIAIFKIQGSEMQHIETIAWAWCDEGWCNQQDAWLTDYDGDGHTDVVQHYTLTDDRGVIKEERFTLLLQNEASELLQDPTAKLDKKKYKMSKI